MTIMNDYIETRKQSYSMLHVGAISGLILLCLSSGQSLLNLAILIPSPTDFVPAYRKVSFQVAPIAINIALIGTCSLLYRHSWYSWGALVLYVAGITGFFAEIIFNAFDGHHISFVMAVFLPLVIVIPQFLALYKIRQLENSEAQLNV